MRKTWPILLAAIIIFASIFLLLDNHKTAAPTLHAQAKRPAVVMAPVTPKPTVSSFDKTQFSLTDPTSLWVVVNKQRPLQPVTYVPPDLVVPNVPLRLSSDQGEMHVRAATASGLEQMFAAAKPDGIDLMLASGYRSYDLQVGVYGAEVKNFGQAKADSESARPGYSEHQSGQAADLEPASRNCEVAVCFADTPEGKWLVANSYKYGFIIRYQADKTTVTGYSYEPWHVRFIGVALATEMHQQGITTLEEFFGLPAVPGY